MHEMTSDLSMTNAQIGSILLVVSSMIAGQILFKLSAQYLVVEKGPISLLASLLTWQFILALVFYSLGTFFWVILLKYVPLSRAYPFVALSFVLLPVASYFLFGEVLSARYFVGLAFFMTGLFLVATT
jgi:drug/metabolite transporter (DMT)-like permease